MNKKQGFTLAEVLITLGVIGVVAAVTLPVLITNIQERIQKEQVRSAKYKFTLATDKMKSLGLLGEQYPTTQAFVTELSKHLKLAKICDNNHLRECWPTDEIDMTDGTSQNVSDIKTGTDLKAFAFGTRNTTTMGIITADGVPMILVYSPKCTPLETERTYSWSTIDNKPETNATTNCVSAIMDVNGNKKPNRIGKDVRAWNSLFASRDFEKNYDPLARNGNDQYECKQLKDKLGIQNCMSLAQDDYWGGAVKKCNEIGLHLPSEQTLAMIASSTYGVSDVGPRNTITRESQCQSRLNRGYSIDGYICVDRVNLRDAVDSSIDFTGSYWSASETNASSAVRRVFNPNESSWAGYSRYYSQKALCVAD